MEMTDAKARDLILKGGRTSEPLYAVAYGLDRNGSDIVSVTAELVSDILSLTWPSELGNSSGNEYGPVMARQVDDTKWSRTFLPQDITAAQEAPLALLAGTSLDPEVKARIYDVLYVRFKKRDYVQEAIKSLLACAAAHADPDDWVSIHNWCARAVFLSGRLGDVDRSRAVFEAFTAAASLVLGGGLRFAFFAFADVLRSASAKHLRASGLLPNADIRRWAETLNLIALYYRLNHDWSYVEKVRESEAETWKLAGDYAAQTQTLRTLVEEYIIESEEHHEVATIRLQAAMNVATARGFRDLLARAKQLLPVAIEREVARMKGHAITLQIEHETIDALSDLLQRSLTISDAFRALAAIPLFTVLPIDEITESSKKALALDPLYALVSSTAFRNNNISHIAAGGSGDKIKAHLSHVLSMWLAKIDCLASHCLAVLFSKEVNERTLDETLLSPTWARPARRDQFREASKHFAKQDWYAAGAMLALAYEGFLRDWLRAAGYPAIKYSSDGTTSDELLNSLAWNPTVEALLGRDHMAMVRYLLCDPELGPNLRNEVAHANAGSITFSPGVVLLIALAIIRLSLLRANQAGIDVVDGVDAEAAEGVEEADGKI